jgi:hypothetical protein
MPPVPLCISSTRNFVVFVHSPTILMNINHRATDSSLFSPKKRRRKTSWSSSSRFPCSHGTPPNLYTARQYPDRLYTCWCHIFYQKPIYITLPPTPPPPLLFRSMPFWLVRLACYTSFFSFHSSIYVETIHQKTAPASSISICFSCSYSSRRGREKGLGSWPGIRIFRGFSYVPYARFDKYNHALYICT